MNTMTITGKVMNEMTISRRAQELFLSALAVCLNGICKLCLSTQHSQLSQVYDML